MVFPMSDIIQTMSDIFLIISDIVFAKSHYSFSAVLAACFKCGNTSAKSDGDIIKAPTK